MTQAKQFKLRPEDIAPLVAEGTWCLATDRIVVDGARIGYMYREAPHAGGESGWRFFAGDEDEEYMRKNENHGVYALNTVANYDPAVLPYLSSPPGSAFDRVDERNFSAIQR